MGSLRDLIVTTKETQDVLSQETARRQTGAADPFVDTIGTAERDALLSSVQEGYKEDPWFQERRNRKKLKEEEGIGGRQARTRMHL